MAQASSPKGSFDDAILEALTQQYENTTTIPPTTPGQFKGQFAEAAKQQQYKDSIIPQWMIDGMFHQPQPDRVIVNPDTVPPDQQHFFDALQNNPRLLNRTPTDPAQWRRSWSDDHSPEFDAPLAPSVPKFERANAKDRIRRT